jgi:hypothetical protein
MLLDHPVLIGWLEMLHNRRHIALDSIRLLRYFSATGSP